MKKKAKAEQRTIVCGDEAGFGLFPMAVRTYAPRGHTPVLKVTVTRDHRSAIGGITPDGRMFMQTQDHAYKGPDVVRFVQVLTREIPGTLLVIWDGATIHHGQVIKDVLAKGGATRMPLERLPASAPELNPQKSRPHPREHRRVASVWHVPSSSTETTYSWSPLLKPIQRWRKASACLQRTKNNSTLWTWWKGFFPV